MSQTVTLMQLQTSEMPLINEALMDEIESLNAIYGEGTLHVKQARSDGTEALLRLPALADMGQLTFCLKFPTTYPDSAPIYQCANVGLFETLDRRIQNIGLLLFLQLEQVFVPGSVCIFDLIEGVVPIISCMGGYVINPEKVAELCPQLWMEDFSWMNKPFINMNNFRDVAECLICCDENYSFRMIQIPCEHSYCPTCLQNGWDLAYEAGESFECCKRRIPDEIVCVYTTVTAESYQEYLRILYEKTTWNAFYCGNRNCNALIGSLNLWALGRGSAKSKGILCPKCQWRTCSLCRAPKHIGNCVVEEELIELFKKADIRRCPLCGDAIEKNGGCAHIQCRRCNNHFWWQDDGSLGKYEGPIYELNRR